jgi:hypothetical protein
MNKRPLLLMLLIAVFAVAGRAQSPPAATTPFSPFGSRAEAESFLRSARIVGIKPLGSGVSNAKKLLLDDGKIRHTAVFKDIDDRRKGIVEFNGFPEIDFKDSWKFEVAAYELDKLLGMNMVPVTIERSVEHKQGSVELWLDGCMNESERQKKGIAPPNTQEWNHQMYKVHLFDNLVFNIDSNKGNLLVNPDFIIFKIDHTRTFKNVIKLRRPEYLVSFSRSLMLALTKLDKPSVTACCRDYLTADEINCLLGRKELILKLYEKLLAEKGDAVVYP